MITLGQASNYRVGQVFRHLFACGGRRDSEILQEKLAGKYSVQPENVALYHTGRSALTVAIQSVAKGKNCPVIIPGLTCIAVVRAVRAAGCTPVFADITPRTLEYDYVKLEHKLQNLTPKNHKSIKSIDKSDDVCYNNIIILVQNTLGISWDVTSIEKLAQTYHASIVEDLAHCAGRIYPDGREVGTVGAVAALSFGKGKAIDTIEGGAVVLRNGEKPSQPTRKPRWSDRWRDRWYPLFGLVSRWNAKLGRCFIGALVKLHWVQRSADAELDVDVRLTHWQAKLAAIQLDQLPQTPLRNFRLVADRPKTLQDLQRSGYYFDETWYDTPVSPQRYANEVDFPAKECPATVEIAKQIINLPTWYHPDRLTQAYEIIKSHEVTHE